MVGFIYPNEIEIQWSILIVVYPYITGLVAGAFILASLVKVFNVKELQPTYRLALLTALAFLLIAPLPLAAPPRPAGAFLRDVHDPQSDLGHGHVRLRLSLVSDAGASAGDLV